MESPCRWMRRKGQSVELHLIPWNIILALKLLILHLRWSFSPNLGFSTLGDYCVGPAVMKTLEVGARVTVYSGRTTTWECRRRWLSPWFCALWAELPSLLVDLCNQRPRDAPNTRYSTKSCGLSTDISSWSFAWINSFYVFYSRILGSCSYLCFCQLPFLSLLPFLKPKTQENADQMRCRIYYFLGSPNPS